MVTVSTSPHDRPADCAGRFYPADQSELARTVDRFVSDGRGTAAGSNAKAIIAPHAGYIYSGPVAGSAYRAIPSEVIARTQRVLLIGPSHFVRFAGVAMAPHTGFQTPLGRIPVDPASRTALESLDSVRTLEKPHKGEHSLEVHLPFIQRVFGDVRVIPLIVGEASVDDIATLLETVGGGDETFWVISSDLSHFEPHESAVRHDTATAEEIESLRGDALGPYDACGHRSIRGLLQSCRHANRRARRLDLRTSADTAGDPQRVVGYGAWIFE